MARARSMRGRSASSSEPDHRPDRGEDRRDEVAQQRGGEQDRCQRPVPACAQTGRHHPEEEQGEGEREGERELAGECREQVAPVDREARLEEEGERGRREAPGARVAQPCQPTEGESADREQQCSEDGDQLEGDVVGHHRVKADGDQAREREVEGVEREAVVPARIPAGELAVGEQVGLEEGGQCHVRPGVAAGGCGVCDEQRGVELAERDHDHPEHRDGVGEGRAQRGPGEPGEPPRSVGGRLGGTLPRGLDPCGDVRHDGQVGGHLRAGSAAARPRRA